MLILARISTQSSTALAGFPSKDDFLHRVRYQLGRNSTLNEEILGDGLDDDIVSTVEVKRNKKQLMVSAHVGQSDKRNLVIPGADDRLDLNGYIYVGGYLNPPPQYPSFHRVNFRGCMFVTMFDDLNFIDGALKDKTGFSHKNLKITSEPAIPPRAMNFNHDTFIKMIIQFRDPVDPTKILQKFYGSFEFRTVLFKGTILQASSVSIKFQRSQLTFQSGGDTVEIDFPNEGQANDGR